MKPEEEIFNRARRLVGDESMRRLSEARVIVFGVGGVGSWCVESLVRSGVRHLTIVDSDCVCITNINRQLMANTTTIGRVKVDALKEYLLKINPTAQIEVRKEIFCRETADSFPLNDYDYIVDAIDTLQNKVLLIEMATSARGKFFSSMGAALKIDPTRIKVAEFWKVEGCPLARALRQRFKRQHRFPRKKFLCVYSDELLENLGPDTTLETPLPDNADYRRAQINGSLHHITSIFGITLAGLIIKDLCSVPKKDLRE